MFVWEVYPFATLQDLPILALRPVLPGWKVLVISPEANSSLSDAPKVPASIVPEPVSLEVLLQRQDPNFSKPGEAKQRLVAAHRLLNQPARHTWKRQQALRTRVGNLTNAIAAHAPR